MRKKTNYSEEWIFFLWMIRYNWI